MDTEYLSQEVFKLKLHRAAQRAKARGFNHNILTPRSRMFVVVDENVTDIDDELDSLDH